MAKIIIQKENGSKTMEKSVEDQKPDVSGIQKELDIQIENCAILKTRCFKLHTDFTDTKNSLLESQRQCEEKGTQATFLH